MSIYIDSDARNPAPSRAGSRKAMGDITNNVNLRNGPGNAQKKPTNRATMPTFTTNSSQSVNSTVSSHQDSDMRARDADDIDSRDANNPLMATHYVQEIYEHMREKEVNAVSSTYMQHQPNINEKMRAILFDWLIEVHLKFKCVPETWFLTTNIIDRFLSCVEVERSKLQLVGVTAFMLAAKYEEIYPPELRDLVYITDRAYTKEEIISMEAKILKELEFKVTIASTHCFLVRYLKAAHADRRMVWLACFITERVVHDYSMLQFLPSMIASCAVYLSRKNLQRNPWSPTLLKYTNYSESALRPCLQAMTNILNTKTSLTAVTKKYTSQKFGSVATMTIEGI